MYYAGILVTALTGEMKRAQEEVTRLGLEVFQEDPERGRFIAVMECATVEEEAKTFRSVIALPGVADASVVVNQKDEEVDRED